MRKAKLAALCLAVAGFLGLGNMARAETVTAKLVGLSPFAGGDLVLNGTAISGDGVGELEWDGTGFGNNSPFNGPFTSFCIDLQEVIQFNNVYSFDLNAALSTAPKATAYPAPLSGPMGPTKANEMSELFGSHFGSLSTADDLQAFQLAIWNIVYDTDATVSSGIFAVTGGIDSTAISEANSWLTEALDPSNLALHHDNQLVALTGIADSAPFPQDQIVHDPNIPIDTGVPLPSSLLAGSVLLAGLGIARVGRKVVVAPAI